MSFKLSKPLKPWMVQALVVLGTADILMIWEFVCELRGLKKKMERTKVCPNSGLLYSTGGIRFLPQISTSVQSPAVGLKRKEDADSSRVNNLKELFYKICLIIITLRSRQDVISSNKKTE